MTVAERVTAGRAAQRALTGREAVRIFTGAPMPAGADTVFMQEDVRVEGAAVIVPPGLKRGANRRLAGEDVRAGSTVLPAGRRLAVQDVALAAAVGLTSLEVRRRVRVAMFSTGDEIVEPGTPRPAPAVFDANRYLLAGLIERLGGTATDLGILPDDPGTLARAIAAAAVDHDLVVTSACRPARPTTCARRWSASAGWYSGASPSSPADRWRWVSSRDRAQATPRSSGCPAIRRRSTSPSRGWCARCCCGSPAPPPPRCLACRCARPFLPKKSGRREYVRVKLVRAADGVVEAVKHAQEGAGVITSLTETDGLVELPEDATTVERARRSSFFPTPRWSDDLDAHAAGRVCAPLPAAACR